MGSSVIKQKANGKANINVNRMGNDNNVHISHYENCEIGLGNNLVAEYTSNPTYVLPITPKALQRGGGLISVLGLLSSIATLLSFFGFTFDLSELVAYWLTFIVGFFIFGFGFSLNRRGFETMPIIWGRGLNLEVQPDGKIAVVRVDGECPVCNGKLSIITEQNQKVGVCARNSNHIFDFDHTLFKGERLSKVSYGVNQE